MKKIIEHDAIWWQNLEVISHFSLKLLNIYPTLYLKTLSVFSSTKLSMMTRIKRQTQHKGARHRCRYTECQFADCHGDDMNQAKSTGLGGDGKTTSSH